ncbi:MAG: GntR family transcriptional regulator [Alphaproteobacteria bacterium]|nr:GntR family transcriptional regulator [Alphaproteobacteria bacterium]
MTAHNGPRCRAVAEALADDIRDGRLAGGARLPTHRDLAWQLRITIGTCAVPMRRPSGAA